MEGPSAAQKWLENLAKGRSRESRGGQSREFSSVEHLCLAGIRVVSADEGRIRCAFVVPEHLTDTEGNWHAGAIATLMDAVGTAAIMSHVKQIQVSVDFQISFFSTAKFNEEVEIDAKIKGQQGNVSAMTVELRKKGITGEMVALGKQWMASVKLDQSKL